MLSLHAIKGPSEAAKYFSNADYYAIDGEENSIPSQWSGKAAETLGLTNEVNINDLQSALKGQLPNGPNLGRERKDATEHKPGWDFTFSAPKSVSILALVGGDKRLIQAHQDAVSIAMKYLEENHAYTRLGKGNRVEQVKTGNLVYAQFGHTTSRELDPQLHTHNVIQNMTQLPNGEWRSLHSDHLYHASMVAGQVYRSALSQKVNKLGYETVHDNDKGFFEIKSVPQAAIALMSKRRQQVEKAAKEFGYVGPQGMEKATLRSRSSKKTVNQTELNGEWQQELKELHYDPKLDVDNAVQNTLAKEDISPAPTSERSSALQDVEFAYRHLAEREAVFTQDDLISVALKKGLGHYSLDDVGKAVRGLLTDGTLIPATLQKGRIEIEGMTTKKALEQEKYILRQLQRGMNHRSPIASKAAIKSAIQERTLEQGQQNAVELILSTRDQFVGIQGYAGTGKTYMLAAVNAVSNAKGFTVRGFSPTASAAVQLENDSGIKSQTLASHLVELENNRGPQIKLKELWVVDEGSLVNSDDMASLLTHARRSGARIALVGDKKQIAAIDWGKPFYQMMRGGMKVAVMDKILRQKDSPALLSSIYSFYKGNPRQSFADISDSIYEIQDENVRMQALIDRVLNVPEQERNELLVIIPDNETRAKVMKGIQQGLRERGIVGDSQVLGKVLVNAGRTRIEKGAAQFYSAGGVVQFGRDYPTLGVIKGESLTVMSSVEGVVTLKNAKGRLIEWRPDIVAGSSKNGAEFYFLQERELGVGDKFTWKKNDKALGLKNGAKGVVENITGSSVSVLFEDGIQKTIDVKTHQHWDLGYAATAFSAQGQTYQNAIFLAESWRRNVVSMTTTLVALTRAKVTTHIYTDNREKLISVLPERTGQKTSALEGTKEGYKAFKDGKGAISTPGEKPNLLKSVAAKLSEKVKGALKYDLEI